MFSPDIVNSDAFLDMPVSSQALYFHLGMSADDDGFVNPKKIMRLVGASEDDLKILLAKRFLLSFESGVVVIKHWLIHNLIRSDRYKETRYLDEKSTLIVKENKSYSDSTTKRQPNDNQMEPQVRLSKVRLGKNTDAPDGADSKKTKYEPVDLLLAAELSELIRENTPTFKAPNLETWASHVRLMRERDDRTEEQIQFVIRWSQKDHFWSANILSTKKLREKFDTLVAQIKRKSTPQATGRGLA